MPSGDGQEGFILEGHGLVGQDSKTSLIMSCDATASRDIRLGLPSLSEFLFLAARRGERHQCQTRCAGGTPCLWCRHDRERLWVRGEKDASSTLSKSTPYRLVSFLAAGVCIQGSPVTYLMTRPQTITSLLPSNLMGSMARPRDGRLQGHRT